MIVEPQKKKYCLVCTEYVTEMPFVKPGIYGRNDWLHWGNSYVREWLNGEFLETCFSDEEKQRMLTTKIRSEHSGFTNDSIYILKKPEFNKYFFSDPSPLNKFIDYGKPDIFRDANGYRELSGVVIQKGDYRRKTFKFYKDKSTIDFPIRPVMWITAD